MQSLFHKKNSSGKKSTQRKKYHPMETLAYIHCASAYGELDAIESVASAEIRPSSHGLKGKKFSMLVALSLLPIILGGAIMAGPQEAQAGYRHCGSGYCKVHYRTRYKYKYVLVRKRVRVRRKRIVCYFPVKHYHVTWKRVVIWA